MDVADCVSIDRDAPASVGFSNCGEQANIRSVCDTQDTAPDERLSVTAWITSSRGDSVHAARATAAPTYISARRSAARGGSRSSLSRCAGRGQLRRGLRRGRHLGGQQRPERLLLQRRGAGPSSSSAARGCGGPPRSARAPPWSGWQLRCSSTPCGRSWAERSLR